MSDDCNQHKKLIVLSPPQWMEGEIHLAEKLIHEGIDGFHVRKPGWDRAQMAHYIGSFPATLRQKIILHDHYALADKYGLLGIHISQKHRGKGFEKIHPHRQVSVSTHSLKELEQLEHRYAYAFLSPIFDSISKQGYRSGFDLHELKTFFRRHTSPVPVVALGGISRKNLPLLKHIGFTGIALLGALWMQEDHHLHESLIMEEYFKIKEHLSAL